MRYRSWHHIMQFCRSRTRNWQSYVSQALDKLKWTLHCCCFATVWTVKFNLYKGQTNKDYFFKPTFLSKNERTNSTLLLVDLFLFVFWKKLKATKKHFEINWFFGYSIQLSIFYFHWQINIKLRVIVLSRAVGRPENRECQ